MNGLGSILGRGLLVLALGGFAIACGDDDSPGTPDDDAGAGSGGSSGSGGAGSGAGTGGGGGGSDAGPDVTVGECVDMTDTNTGGGVSEVCAMCACEEGLDETVACDSMCWGLISCFSENCAGIMPGSAEATTCATTNCIDFIGGAPAATPLGAILRGACADECVPPEGDAGVDAGN